MIYRDDALTDCPTCAMVGAGEWVRCGGCGGYTDFEGPSECGCNGGLLWRYPSGVLALYPGGPFTGSVART